MMEKTQFDDASRLLKGCHVQLERIDLPEPLQPQPVRKNRGLKMKRILLEEKRTDWEGVLPKYKSVSMETASCSQTLPEVSDSEDLICSSKAVSCTAPCGSCDEDDSWSYYSDDDTFKTPINSCSEKDSWSFYSDEDTFKTDIDSCSEDDSWSYYSDEENFKSPAGSCSEEDSAYNCSNEHPSHVASVENKKLSATVRAQSTSQITGKKVIIKNWERRCCICSEKVETSMIRHMKIHFPNDDYACPQCHTRFKSLSSLRLHLKRTCYEYNQQQVDPEKPEEAQNLYKCDECEKAFRYKLSLEIHKRTHSQLYCEVCRKVLRDAAMLAIHKASHTPFQCTLCEMSFKLFRLLQSHYESIHKINRPYKCNHCPKSFSHIHLFIQHEWKHTGYLPFQCQDCGMRFRSCGDLLTHQKVHTGQKPYLCSECGKAFSQKFAMLHHLSVIHGKSWLGKWFSCSECQQSFERKRDLTQHQKNDHYQVFSRRLCCYCGKMITVSGMARHKLMHTGEKPFKCPASGCDRSFRTASDMKFHVIAHHTTERRFKCDICGKGFIFRCLLKTHLKTHSGEKPLVCHICGREFLWISNLHRHKKFVHHNKVILVTKNR